MKKLLVAMGLVTAFAVASQAAVVEFWDFEDGTNGQTFAQGNTGSGWGSYGVNGTLMNGWDNTYGPSFQSIAASPSSGGTVGLYSVYQDGYVWNDGNALVPWSSPDWTIQMHVLMEDADGWETFMAKMGSSFAVNESDFYLQRKGMDNNELRLNYRNADGIQMIVDGVHTLNAYQWYGIAAVADSTAGTLSLYLDWGAGYQLEGQLSGLTNNLGVYSSTFDWAFYRDYYGGGFDPTIGRMDNVQIDDTALSMEELRAIPEPATIGLVGIFGAAMLFMRRRFKI